MPSTVEPSPGGGFLYGIECLSTIRLLGLGRRHRFHGPGIGPLDRAVERLSMDRRLEYGPRAERGLGGRHLSSISCVGPSACWAVGSYGAFGGGGGDGFQPQSFIEYWNGSSWSIEPSPDVGPIDLLNAVSCIAGVGCTAVGTTATLGNGNDPGLRSFVEQMTFPPACKPGLSRRCP